jgi:uncharacterized protein DUF4153
VTWAPRAVLAIAILAALTLVGRPVGLGLTLVLIAVFAAARRRGVTWWLLAGALAAVATLRAAAWVVWPALVMSVAIASLAATGGAGWRQVGVGLVRAFGMPRAPLVVLRAAPRQGRPALRAAGIAVLLLAVFVPLFVTADAAFAHLLDAIVPQESADRPITRAAVFLVVAALGGGLILAARAEPPRGAGPARFTLARVEWTVPLALLVALFAAFVALQLTALYGGNDYVLKTSGLTYAEYARSGFAQLIAAAALTLAVIAAAARWASDGRLLRALLGALCALTLVVLASAFTRLHLYEDAYGFTRLRLAADAAILWLAGLFVLVLLAGATRRARWLPRGVVALSATGLLAFAVSNPDGRIAARNIDRYERTGRIDTSVLRGLSADATPALRRLSPRLVPATCAPPDGVVGFNVGRARAAC